jgi:zinc protease
MFQFHVSARFAATGRGEICGEPEIVRALRIPTHCVTIAMMHCKPLVFLIALALAACAPQQERIAAVPAPLAKPAWAFEASDVPRDPAWTFGQLSNGMRYAIRGNATPRGTGLVRLLVDAGSLDESKAERGFAHYVEHMAFNGSTNVPEGEMVKLLERKGLAFGAHTNASTSFEYTLYQLDLPKNDPTLLDTALMLMRETAGELTISQDAVERERGVVLAELRDRNTFALRNLVDQMQFTAPKARYPDRLAIGTPETLNAATAESLRAFWRREYIPAKTTLVVIGDFDVAAVEAAIQARFADWKAAPGDPQPSAGPLDPDDKARTDIFIDPALSERITATRNAPWRDEPDSIAQRRENLLRQIAYGIINRRLVSQTRQADPPFRGAGIGTSDTFEAARTTNLVVDTVDGQWERGLEVAVIEYRRALSHGFTAAEVAEQIANIHTAAKNSAASADTRSNDALFGVVWALLDDHVTPVTPQSSLERLDAFIPQITPDAVLAALNRSLVPLDAPLLRFQGRRDPSGGAAAIRKAWNAAMKAPIGERSSAATAGFAYTDFGPPGTVIADATEPQLGIRTLRFANGVRLNLKRTNLDKGRMLVQLSLDGGKMLDTRDDPLATDMIHFLTAGGLGKHSSDELQTLLAGRSVGARFSATTESFVASALTTPGDLELQLQLLAAFCVDPGYRREGEALYFNSINDFFQTRLATPVSALWSNIYGILSDNDPRFTTQPVEAYRKLSFAKLKGDISDRLAKGAVEIGIVGDFDEAQAIAAVAKTFAALPQREADFRPYLEQRQRSFSADRSERIIHHTGAPDQAIVGLTWKTRDGEDPEAELALEMLQRVAQLEVTETLREKLGKAYSPRVSSESSRFWRDWGTFSITASVAVKEVAATRAAILATLAELRDRPVSDDLLLRARAPMIDALDNALKSNRGWLNLVDRAQTEPDRIERQLKSKERLLAITAAQLQDLARRYLAEKDALPVLVLPAEPKPQATVSR